MLSAGAEVSVASCCIASALASQQTQCCLRSLASALQVAEGSASSLAKVQPSREGTPAPPSQLLQAPKALQQVLPATPPGVAKWAAKWRARPRYLAIKIGGELLGHSKTLPPVQCADSPEGTPPSPSSSTTAPLAFPPPYGSDIGDVPQPQVNICPACSVVGSWTVGVPAAASSAAC